MPCGQFNENQAALAAMEDQALPVAQYQDGLSMNTIFAVPSLGIDPAIGLEMYRKQDGSSTYIWRDTDRVPCGVSVPLYRGTVGITGEYKASVSPLPAVIWEADRCITLLWSTWWKMQISARTSTVGS